MNRSAPRRRVFRFGLRSLLLALAAVNIALGAAVHHARDRQLAIRAILDLGGTVVFRDADPTLKSRWLSLNGDHFRGKVSRVQLDGVKLGESTVVHLAHLPTVERLSLRDTSFSDDGVKWVGKLRHLRVLDITNTHVTDAGLIYLRSLDNLEQLFLKRTRITSEGVDRLRRALPNCDVDCRRM